MPTLTVFQLYCGMVMLFDVGQNDHGSDKYLRSDNMLYF